MERNWTTVGQKHTQGKRKQLEAMFSRMEWREIPCEMGMMPGMAIKEAIKQLHIPKVSHVAHSHELAPYGLLGIKARYRNGNAVIYLVDDGLGVTPIVSDFIGDNG